MIWEKIEWIIKKGQSINTGNIGYKTQKKDKEHKTEDKQKISDTAHIKKNRHELSTREGKAVPVSNKTPVVLPIVKYGKRLVGDKGKIKIYI